MGKRESAAGGWGRRKSLPRQCRELVCRPDPGGVAAVPAYGQRRPAEYRHSLGCCHRCHCRHHQGVHFFCFLLFKNYYWGKFKNIWIPSARDPDHSRSMIRLTQPSYLLESRDGSRGRVLAADAAHAQAITAGATGTPGEAEGGPCRRCYRKRRRRCVRSSATKDIPFPILTAVGRRTARRHRLEQRI